MSAQDLYIYWTLVSGFEESPNSPHPEPSRRKALPKNLRKRKYPPMLIHHFAP